MIKQLFSVWDSKAETWSVPFASDNKATALREFATLVQDGRTLIGMHPADFDLYKVGVFDVESGIVKSLSLDHLANGADLLPKSKES